MNSDDRLAQSLSEWLGEDAAHRVPDHLAEVLVHTAGTRQRPWWSSLERLLPMTTTARMRDTAPRPLLIFAIAALLVLALAALALFAGAARVPHVPLGPASNGRIVVANGPTIYTYAADGSDPRTLVTNGTAASAYSISPDGTRLAYKVDAQPPLIRIVGLADATAVEYPIAGASVLADEPVAWSPDGTSIAAAGVAAGHDDLFVLDVASGTSSTPAHDALDPHLGVWLPSFSPDGQWILFAATIPGITVGELHVVHPDGTDFRGLGVGTETGNGGGPVWSPRRDVHRIAYLTFADGGLQTRIFDLDTDHDYLVGQGFWPSWSPDGSKLATCCATIYDTASALAGKADSVTLFEQFDANCGDVASSNSGRSICSAVVWSPDGRWVVAGDVAGKDLLLAPADGSQPPRRITLGNESDVSGFRPPLAWQPIWP